MYTVFSPTEKNKSHAVFSLTGRSFAGTPELSSDANLAADLALCAIFETVGEGVMRMWFQYARASLCSHCQTGRRS